MGVVFIYALITFETIGSEDDDDHYPPAAVGMYIFI